MENTIKYPRFRWFILLTVVTGFAVVGLLQVAPTAVLNMISKDLGITVGQVSAAFTGFYVLACATSTIFSGYIIDRFGFTPSVIGGSILAIIASLLTLLIGNSIGGVIIIRILTGLAAGPISACVSYVAVRWFPPNQRGIFTGFQGSGIPVGIAIGFAAMVSAVKATGNWKSSLALLSIAPMVLLILSVITAFVREPVNITEESNKPGNGSFKAVLRLLPFYTGVFCMFAFMWIQQSFTDLIPGYISIPGIGLGFGTETAGRYMSITQTAMILGCISSGFILEKIFKSRTKPLIMIGFLFAGLSMMSVRFEFIYGNAGLLTASFFFAGFFEGFIMPMIAAFISMNYPRDIVGKVFGISFGICLFGGTIGVFAGSALVHFTGHYNISIIIIGIIAFAGFISAMGLNRTGGNN